MHIFPKEMHTAFIFSFPCDLTIYKEVSPISVTFRSASTKCILNVLQLSGRQLICISSLWHSRTACPRMSQLMEPGAQSLSNRGLSSTAFLEVQNKIPQLRITDPPQNIQCYWCTISHESPTLQFLRRESRKNFKKFKNISKNCSVSRTS